MSQSSSSLPSDVLSDEIVFTPAFIEGVIIACCCVSKKESIWKTILFGDEEKIQEYIDEVEEMQEKMNELYHQLSELELSYELPIDDSTSFLEQLRMLRDWASGFWVGAEKTSLNKKITQEENKEFLKDLKQIVAMDLISGTEDSSENFEDIFEIKEYCRVAVINLFLSTTKQHAVKH